MRKYLEASRSTIFYQLTPVVTFITALLLLGETVSAQKFWGIGLIVGGNMIAVYKHGGHITRRGLFFALVTVIALGFAYVADKAAFSHYPLGAYMIISYFRGAERLINYTLNPNPWILINPCPSNDVRRVLYEIFLEKSIEVILFT